MDTEYTTKVRILVPVPVQEAFAFFENPQTMLLLPDFREASGWIGVDGAGRLKGANSSSDWVNDWHVVEFDPPTRCVLAQSITVTYRALDVPAHLEALETSTYRSRWKGSSLLLRSTRSRWTDLAL